MTDYDIGYGKPPIHTRFKIGNKAGLKGRPRRKTSTPAELIESGLNGTAQYTEGGRVKKATWFQLSIKKTINDALKGNLKAGDGLLKLLKQLNQYGGNEALRVVLHDWQPEHAGQTGEQKTRQLAIRHQASVGMPDSDDDNKPEGSEE